MLSERIEFGKLRDLAEQAAYGTLSFRAEQLPRVRALLVSDKPANIAAQVALSRSEIGLAQLDLQLTGELFLVCQRCLSGVSWDLQLAAKLTVLRHEDEAEQLLDPFDSVLVENGELDLVKLAEDEILSAVPLAALHERMGDDCSPAIEIAAAEEPASRPFAGLAHLMGREVN